MYLYSETREWGRRKENTKKEQRGKQSRVRGEVGQGRERDTKKEITGYKCLERLKGETYTRDKARYSKNDGEVERYCKFSVGCLLKSKLILVLF